MNGVAFLRNVVYVPASTLGASTRGEELRHHVALNHRALALARRR
jgi:hypothetical protein